MLSIASLVQMHAGQYNLPLTISIPDAEHKKSHGQIKSY
jgi:hypothetical protein